MVQECIEEALRAGAGEIHQMPMNVNSERLGEHML
jgi:hypothetical protein